MSQIELLLQRPLSRPAGHIKRSPHFSRWDREASRTTMSYDSGAGALLPEPVPEGTPWRAWSTAAARNAAATLAMPSRRTTAFSRNAAIEAGFVQMCCQVEPATRSAQVHNRSQAKDRHPQSTTQNTVATLRPPPRPMRPPTPPQPDCAPTLHLTRKRAAEGASVLAGSARSRPARPRATGGHAPGL